MLELLFTPVLNVSICIQSAINVDGFEMWKLIFLVILSNLSSWFPYATGKRRFYS